MENCLTIEELSVAYRTDRATSAPFRNLKLQLETGKFYGLIGTTGSGKSTLLKAIANVLPSNAVVESGSVQICGEEVIFRKFCYCPALGVVLQNPYDSLNPTLKIWTQFRMTYGFLLSYRHQTQFMSEVLKVLDMVELPKDVLEQYPSQLSGGMNQRINIALSLLRHPQLLLLDEPTSALDATLKYEMIDLIASIQRSLGITVLLISHDIQLVRQYADEIFILQNGILEAYQDNSMEVELPTLSEPASQSEILLQWDNLTKSFGKRLVLDHVNFCVKKGSCFGIVGRSGAGKSTICNIIMGLYTADSGQLKCKPGLKCEMLFQNSFSSLDPMMEVRQILNEARMIEQLAPLEDAEFEGWFERFSLPLSVLSRKASQLSGGQRQLVAIIRILLAKPDIVILDEPTSAMDVFLQKQLLAFLKKIQKELGLTYILVSHDPDVIRYMCHDVLKLK